MQESSVINLICEKLKARGKLGLHESSNRGARIRVYVVKGQERRPVTSITLDNRILGANDSDIESIIDSVVNQALDAAVNEPALREPPRG